MTKYTSAVEELEDVAVEEIEDVAVGMPSLLVVYNDDENTFDWVIKCFMDVLKYSSQQAEQLAMIIHFKGKATVKTAPKPELRPKKEALTDKGLSAVIEDL
ncbi:MAG: ATP-dependent Clp protease adaptor ClpS [Saprospiraceae bacterium]